MALSPGVYLGMRRGDAAVLAVSALALVLSVGSAGASSPVVGAAADPSVSPGDGALVYERVGGEGVLLQAGSEQPLPGSDPAIGGSYIAVRDGETIRLLDRATLTPIGDLIPAPGTDAIAVSGSWLAYRSRSAENDRLLARDISNPAAPGPELQIDVATDPNQVSPPSLDGATLLYAVARVKGSRIVRYALPSGGKDALLRSNEALLFNPSVFGDSFAYTRTDGSRTKLLVRDLDGKGQGRTILKRRRSGGELWATALTADKVYVTLLDPSSTSAGAEVVSQPVSGGRGKGKK
jgi:hypothetical protein